MAILSILPGLPFNLSTMANGTLAFTDSGFLAGWNVHIAYGDMVTATLPPHDTWSTRMTWLGPDIDVEDGVVVGGIVTDILMEAGLNGEPYWALEGVSVDAARLFEVARTSSLVDDTAFLTSLFRGPDHIQVPTWAPIGAELHGYGGDDEIEGGGGADVLYGDAGQDLVRGGSGNDSLYGGAGNDTLDGGFGDDQYFVSSPLDVVIETSPWSTADPGGRDTVNAAVSFVLGDRLEDLVLLGNGAIAGTGNALANTLTGNASANVLAGMGGADTVSGGAGADTIVVHAVVGSTADSSRVVTEGSNNDGGQDVVRGFSLAQDSLRVVATAVARFVHGEDTSVGLGKGVETAAGRSSFAANTGLVELNQATNNAWGDVGDIAVSFQAPSAILTEAAFEARLQYVLTGTAAGNTLVGGRLADTLDGGGGNDGIAGSGGLDRLTGGAGNDVFDYNALADSGILSTTRDVIVDFVRGQDRIDLRTLDANATLSGDQAFGGTFVDTFTAAGQLRFAAGVLYGNTDADAAAEFSIRLHGVSALAAADVLL